MNSGRVSIGLELMSKPFSFPIKYTLQNKSSIRIRGIKGVPSVQPVKCLFQTDRQSSSDSVGLGDYPQVDILGWWYKSVNFGVKTSPV